MRNYRREDYKIQFILWKFGGVNRHVHFKKRYRDFHVRHFLHDESAISYKNEQLSLTRRFSVSVKKWQTAT